MHPPVSHAFFLIVYLCRFQDFAKLRKNEWRLFFLNKNGFWATKKKLVQVFARVFFVVFSQLKTVFFC
jgi:hypothetical protein